MYIFDIRDKEGRGSKRDKDVMAFAEEILVTKSDLEEKTQSMAELKTKVEELTMQSEYQLRLKDLNYNEKLKEATEKFTQELDGDKKNYELLLQAKNDMEMEYEEKIKQLEERHQQQLQALEAQYQQKIMAEVERYQQLGARRTCRARSGTSAWSRTRRHRHHSRHCHQQPPPPPHVSLPRMQNEEHEARVQELTDGYENQLQEEAAVLERERGEKEGLIQEFEDAEAARGGRPRDRGPEGEVRDQARVGARGGAPPQRRERYQRKKFTALQKDIEDQKEEIRQLFNNKKALHEHIASLEKDIAGLKKEIRERDETIGEEKRIYDLKKKNQSSRSSSSSSTTRSRSSRSRSSRARSRSWR